MTTFVLVPGAGGVAWYWHRVVPLLEQAGHRAVAVDLPGDDPGAGLSAYAALVESAMDGSDDVVLVGQSLGGFTVATVAARRSVTGIVLLNAMIPVPGETPGQWWDDVGQEDARVAAAHRGGWPSEFDLETYFLHDVDPAVAAAGEPHQRPESEAVFESVCELSAWPDVPIHVMSGADDRFFPLDFQRRVARDRLGVEPDVVPGGHLAALSHPTDVAAYLLGVVRQG